MREKLLPMDSLLKTYKFRNGGKDKEIKRNKWESNLQPLNYSDNIGIIELNFISQFSISYIWNYNISFEIITKILNTYTHTHTSGEGVIKDNGRKKGNFNFIGWWLLSKEHT